MTHPFHAIVQGEKGPKGIARVGTREYPACLVKLATVMNKFGRKKNRRKPVYSKVRIRERWDNTLFLRVWSVGTGVSKLKQSPYMLHERENERGERGERKKREEDILMSV